MAVRWGEGFEVGSSCWAGDGDGGVVAVRVGFRGRFAWVVGEVLGVWGGASGCDVEYGDDKSTYHMDSLHICRWGLTPSTALRVWREVLVLTIP